MQVVRYTALLSGIFYGISHRRTLQKAHDEEVKHHAIHEREHLIAQAKEAWKKKQEESSKSDGGESLRTPLGLYPSVCSHSVPASDHRPRKPSLRP